VAEYVAEVGQRVAAHAKRPIAYHFHLISDHDFINAFAIPGGHVFIGLGLIDQMKSEDELAFVLSHEIEHIDHYHPAERVQMEAQLRHLNLGILAAVVEIPMSLWQAGYSKDEEFEADREGVRLAALGGYAPLGAVEMFERFLQLEQAYVAHSATPVEELSHVAIEGLEGYFRSHPETAERLAQTRRLITDEHLPADRRIRPLLCETTAKAARRYSR
jgi:predicted Zn-dependent protease